VGVGYGQPAVVGDKIFLTGALENKDASPEHLLCLSLATGKEIWKQDLTTPEGRVPAQYGAGPRATPTVDGDLLYVLGSTGTLACRKTTDGSSVWSKNLKADFGGNIPTWGYAESVLVDGDLVICTPGSKTAMVALNKKTGEPVWECKENVGAAGYSSVMISNAGGVKQYVQQSMNFGVGVRASDGKLLWKTNGIKRAIAVIPSPVVSGDLVFFTAGYGAGCELIKLASDGAGGVKAETVYATTDLISNHHGGVIFRDGAIFGHTDHSMKGAVERNVGTWVAVALDKDPEKAVLWRSDKLEKGSITYADGHFYCYGQTKGTLVRIKASKAGWEEAGRFDIPKTTPHRPPSGKVWPHPVVAAGKLFLRDYDLLFCYDVKGPAN
jgi:outer membrane protein assembly factor BamB